MEHDDPLGHEKIATGVKEKLANLEKYMPDQPDIVYEFARFLSERASDELILAGFYMTVSLALGDLQKGVDGFDGKRINSRLVGAPPMGYKLLGSCAPKMAEVLFGKEYMDQVKEARSQVKETYS
ncbi:MAG: hypothetical protein PHO48_01495 [Candidatus Gracilibacteria bacterium]|nr:hypothetical protein [Candidatus Gracilibacteria bacterium]MDD5178975.1 hypothetical protein [Candidatus Gracilibacteria bacterium]